MIGWWLLYLLWWQVYSGHGGWWRRRLFLRNIQAGVHTHNDFGELLLRSLSHLVALTRSLNAPSPTFVFCMPCWLHAMPVALLLRWPFAGPSLVLRVHTQGIGRVPGGHDRFVPDATLSGEWDFVGGIAGQGGEGTKESVQDGNAGAVRLRLPGYFDMRLEKMFKVPAAVVDRGVDSEHAPGVRPSASSVARVRHLLSNPRPVKEE